MTGTEDAKFANTPNKRKSRSKSRAENTKKAKMDTDDGNAVGKGLFLFFIFPSYILFISLGVNPFVAQFFRKKMGHTQRFAIYIIISTFVKKPKHLLCGKRGIGKADRR